MCNFAFRGSKVKKITVSIKDNQNTVILFNVLFPFMTMSMLLYYFPGMQLLIHTNFNPPSVDNFGTRW